MAVRNNETDESNITFDNPGDVLFTQTPFSAMAWANLYSGGTNPTGRSIILMWDNPVSKSWAIRAAGQSGAFNLRVQLSFDGAVNTTLETVFIVSLDTWFHVGIDFDGDDLRVWVNGILDSTLATVGTVFDDDEDFGIGGTGDGGNQQDVDVEDARYYDRILSDEEWLTIYTTQGHDGIVEGLQGRMVLNDREAGILVTAKNPIDAGPNQVAFATAYGTPVSSYVLQERGMSFRKRV